MKWQGRRSSSNVSRGGGAAKIGGLGLVIMALIYSFFGGNPEDILNLQLPQQQQTQQAADPARRQMEEMLSVVLADTEDVWHAKFQEIGRRYEEPKLVFYEERAASGCGTADKRMGPFYCPRDKTVYMDVSFYNDLTRRFGGRGGDYTMAYVLAHEVGHHVQQQLGILQRVQSIQQRLSESDANRYSVALELQADYFAGVFSYYIQEKGYLDPGDIEEAMDAAGVVGDDHLQGLGRGEIRPETFTHGTSNERMSWFYRGVQHHDFEHGDTFAAYKLPLQF